MHAYGEISTLFYELDKPTAPELALAWYEAALRQSGGRVLEPMCGSGRFLVPLLKRGLMVDGFDPSEPMLKACREKAAAARFAVESPWSTWDPANAEDRPDGSHPPTPRIRLWQQALETMELFPPPPPAPPDVLVAVPEPVRYTAAFIPASSFCLLDEPATREGLRSCFKTVKVCLGGWSIGLA